MSAELHGFSLDRMMNAVERVRKRLFRACTALSEAEIRYAVVGDCAVEEWLSRIDQSAVRTCKDVAILIRREDLEKTKMALATVGFLFRHVKSVDLFLDGPESKARDAVHIVYAGEKVRSDYPTVSPQVEDVDLSGPFAVLALEPLVQMKLNSFRDKDRMHLRDLAGVGLIDETWPHKFEGVLAERLQLILDTPDG